MKTRGTQDRTSGFASIKWIEWEQKAEEGSKSQLPWKGVCGCSTRDCSALLQGAVNADAIAGVLGCWRRWVSKLMCRHWTGNNGQVGRYGVIQQLGGLRGTHLVVERISNSEYNECCRGDFRGYIQEDPKARV